ncbi:UNVERIFIED_CONTAM: hypothetical protein HDU68_003901 [Siphonaria sp. JEL0065]|nr:hypothetical protein HDU68_003901 [Siphonaria sp. JEL0065]
MSVLQQSVFPGSFNCASSSLFSTTALPFPDAATCTGAAGPANSCYDAGSWGLTDAQNHFDATRKPYFKSFFAEAESQQAPTPTTVSLTNATTFAQTSVVTSASTAPTHSTLTFILAEEPVKDQFWNIAINTTLVPDVTQVIVGE